MQNKERDGEWRLKRSRMAFLLICMQGVHCALTETGILSLNCFSI
jgi:hypothetical protein